MAVRVTEKDNGAKALFASLRKLPNKRIKVGIQAPEAQAQHRSGLPMVGIGAVHEFGAPKAGIPARSFLGSTADVNKQKYFRELESIARFMFKNPKLPQKLLGEMVLLGESVRGDVVKRVLNRELPGGSLAQSTLLSNPKREDLPLWDTGSMIGSITSKIGKPSK